MESSQSAVVDSLGMVTLVVEDQDDALAWYGDALGFDVVTDETFEMGAGTSRWLTVAPTEGDGPELSLVAVDDPMYQDRTDPSLESRLGGDTLWMFDTADLDAAVADLEERDVDVDEIQETPWGRMVTVRDPDGNAFQFFEQAESAA